jgi:hypothetical protein
MMPTTQAHAPQDQAPQTDSGKRPYQKPAFRSETIFETMALACGKIAITQNACRQQRKAS